VELKYAFDNPGLRELAPALRSGDLELESYLELICERIELADPQVQAMLPEEEQLARLLSQAHALKERYPDPQTRPGLWGVPVGVKDIFRVDGFETGCGSALPPGLFAGTESTLVQRLREHGALILGKTVTTEFAFFEPGPTRNPHNLAHTPGGSSSGSAAAVAVGYCPLALGSQTVGSVIRPAAFCGVAGFKPTYDLLPLEGVIPYSPSLDHAGFFVPSGADLPFALSCVAGIPEAPTPVWLAGIPEGPYLEQASPEALEAFARQVAVLEQAGVKFFRVPVFEDIGEISRKHNLLAAAELAEVHREWFREYGPRYRPRTAAWIREGMQTDPAEAEAARAGRAALRERLHALMDAQVIDVWLSPAAPGPAPEGMATGNPAMNLPWTYAGLPVATVPAGKAANGLPLGLQLTARAGQDAELAAFTAAVGELLRC
jgi:Asp-tRNA(Asn)/Glu-tRNA(Gln) amidotransferase A subunit family amidase